jgi:tetratricopeptide (TPR) repeat protein
LRLDPKRKNEIVNVAVGKFQKSGPVEVLNLARWLNQKGESKRLVETIPSAAALGSGSLFLAYGDALAALGQWLELETLLGQPMLPIEPVLAELYRARVATQLKKDRQAAAHWEQVHWLSSSNVNALRYVAEYADKLGDFEHAVRAYKRLARHPQSARVAYLALIRIANQRQDLPELRNPAGRQAAHDIVETDGQ